MDIETAVKERKILEIKIAEALRDFNVKTGLRVSGIEFNVIDIRTHEDFSKSQRSDLYSVNIRIEL